MIFEFEDDGIKYYVEGEYIEGEDGDYFYPGSAHDFNVLRLEAVFPDELDPMDEHEIREYILNNYYS